MGFMIDFNGSGAYAGPFEGAGSELLPFQGFTYGKIVKVSEGTSKEAKNSTLKLEIVCEEQEASGMRLMKTQAVTGLRSDKKPNVQGLLDILFSVYSETEPQEKALERVKALEGQQMESAGIIQELTGQRVYLDVTARKYAREDGSDGWATDIRNFVGKQRYVDAKATNIHHRDLPEEALRARAGAASAGAAAGSPATAGGASAGAGASSTKASASGVL